MSDEVHLHRCFECFGIYTCRCDRSTREGMCDGCFNSIRTESLSDLERKRKLKEIMNLIYYQLLRTDMLLARDRGDTKEEDHLLDMMDPVWQKLTEQQHKELNAWKP